MARQDLPTVAFTANSFAMDDATGLPIALEPLVTRVLAPNPSPYTFTGTQTHVVGTTDLAVIDPGPDDPGHLAAMTAVIAGRPVRAIVVTHHHRDHSPASRPLALATGAPIVGAAPFAIHGERAQTDAAFDADYAPDRVLEDGQGIAGDGWTLTALATPGHTSNHLAFALLEAQGGTGALFSGDHVMGWSTTVVSPPDGDMAAYMASLERLKGRDEAIYYPGHGDAVKNPRRLVRHMIGHRRQRERQALRLLGERASALPELTRAMYAGLDERLLPAAERSVLAHLIDLERRDRVHRDGERWAT